MRLAGPIAGSAPVMEPYKSGSSLAGCTTGKARLQGAPRGGSLYFLSFGLEPDAAVEPDDLGIHVIVLDQRPDELGELGGGAHPLGEHHGGDHPGLNSSLPGPAP